jgi:hypothetical protein
MMLVSPSELRWVNRQEPIPTANPETDGHLSRTIKVLQQKWMRPKAGILVSIWIDVPTVDEE